MLHVFFGSDVVTVRQKAFSLTSKYVEEGMKLERIDLDTYVSGVCMNIANSVSLFGEKTVYLIDTPSLDSSFYEEVVASLQAFKESENMFVVVEGTLLAPAKKLFTKYANSIEEVKTSVEARFNAFAMADSLSLKDKKMLWLQLQDAKQAGLSAEEVIGTLWWQLKTLRLAKLTHNADEAGMKDFPYNKAKRVLKNFKDGELESLSRKLLAIYHDGHNGKRDIDMALEKWTLTI